MTYLKNKKNLHYYSKTQKERESKQLELHDLQKTFLSQKGDSHFVDLDDSDDEEFLSDLAGKNTLKIKIIDNTSGKPIEEVLLSPEATVEYLFYFSIFDFHPFPSIVFI